MDHYRLTLFGIGEVNMIMIVVDNFGNVSDLMDR